MWDEPSSRCRKEASSAVRRSDIAAHLPAFGAERQIANETTERCCGSGPVLVAGAGWGVAWGAGDAAGQAAVAALQRGVVVAAISSCAVLGRAGKSAQPTATSKLPPSYPALISRRRTMSATVPATAAAPGAVVSGVITAKRRPPRCAALSSTRMRPSTPRAIAVTSRCCWPGSSCWERLPVTSTITSASGRPCRAARESSASTAGVQLVLGQQAGAVAEGSLHAQAEPLLARASRASRARARTARRGWRAAS